MESINNLTILWALPENELDFKKYEIIINIWKEYFKNVFSPIDTKNFIWENSERFERAIKLIKNTDLIIWELSFPSTWQWIEIWIAYNLEIPIIILAKEWSKISWLIKWNPYIKDIIFYNNFIDLEEKLILNIKKYY